MSTNPFRRGADTPPVLSNTDVAVLQTLNFQKKLDSGKALAPEDFLLIPREALRAIRPGINPQHETMMASGLCRIMFWDAPGDGSYNASGVPMVMTGYANRTGTAMMAGAAAGTIAMNMMNARRARRDAQSRWMDFIPQGMVTVSSHGFYAEDYEQGLLWWDWNSVQAIDVQGPSTVDVLVQTQSWSGRLRVMSDWAELLFVCWVSAAFPQHPHKYLWTNQDWAQRVRDSLGYDPYTGQPVQLPG